MGGVFPQVRSVMWADRSVVDLLIEMDKLLKEWDLELLYVCFMLVCLGGEE